MCPSTLVTAYSSGESSGGRVHTTDLRWRCTENHTGTSAAAPMISAIVALMLEANQELNWRDVQHIIVRTAKSEHLKAYDWSQNGAGFMYSHIFGFGLVDAYAMTKVALKWETVPEKSIQMYSPKGLAKDYDRAYAFMFNRPAIIEFEILESEAIRFTEHVELTVTISAGIRGYTNIFLYSPSGTKSEMLRKRGLDKQNKGFPDWTFMSVQFWGENPVGTWRVLVHDWNEHQSGSMSHRYVSKIKLTVHGTATEPQPNLSASQIKELSESDSWATSLNNNDDSILEPDLRFDRSSAQSSNYTIPELCLSNKLEDFHQFANHTQCHELCDSDFGCCGTEAYHCFRCKTATSINDLTCLDSCPEGQYLDVDNRQCSLCSNVCKTCSSLDTCLSCHPYARMIEATKKSPDGQSLITYSTCSTTCSDGQYIDQDGNCHPCHHTCKTCLGPGSHECKSCSGDLFMQAGSCSKKCPTGWFGEKSSNVCARCDDSCKSCTAAGRENCIECADNMKMNKNTGLCQFVCADRIEKSLCINLKDFCDVELVYRSCCQYCKKMCPDCKDYTRMDSEFGP